MRAEQVGLAQRSQHREERFSAAHFLAEILERVRQCVADGETQRSQAEAVQENVHLMAHPHGAVLQVAVVEAESGIYEDAFHAVALGDLDLAREEFMHHRNRICAQVEVADFADIFALHVTDDHGGIVGGHGAEQFIRAFRAGEVEDIRSGFKARAGDGGLIRLYGNQNTFRPKLADHRDQLGILRSIIHSRGVSQRGFRAHVNDVRTLRREHSSALDGRVG